MQTSVPEAAKELIDELIVANHILYHYKVVDGFGHISVRHDKDPSKYLMARHLAPALVTAADIVTFDLDSNPVANTAPRYYSERYIHGEIYKARPDVISVCHNHAAPLLPFGVTKSSLLPLYHMSAFLRTGVPLFEIRDVEGIGSDMLVRTPKRGVALAKTLGTYPMVLMRGHGATMVGGSIKECVYRSIYAMQNAMIQLDAVRLGGEITFLSPEEAEGYEKYSHEVIDRPWNLWKSEAEA